MQPLKEFAVTVLKGVAIVLILAALLFAPELPDLIPAPHWLNAVLDVAAGLAALQVFKWIIERPDKRATLQASSDNRKDP